MSAKHYLSKIVLITFLMWPTGVLGEVPWQFADNTRYMAMGDSLPAGYGAIPATQGYAYLLYKEGVFDKVPNTLLSNVGLIGATSKDVLEKQVPLAIDPFFPTVITITVGGNDLASILEGSDPITVLTNFQTNLTNIFIALRTNLPNVPIYINNLYDIPEIPQARPIVQAFNQIMDAVAGAFNVPVADVFTAFEGKKGVRLIQRNGADQFEVHPSNAGHRLIANAFKIVIERQ